MQTEPPKNYLEIGAGSGHVARVLNHFFDFETIHLMDIASRYGDRLQQVPNAVEWIGDWDASGASGLSLVGLDSLVMGNSPLPQQGVICSGLQPMRSWS